MACYRILIAVAAAAAFVAGSATAEAQDAGRTRGSVRARPSYFNPFEVSSNQLTLNPFGMIAFAQPAPVTAAASTVAASSALVDAGATTGTSAGIRPPFRPIPRSPFRPPPRPPF